MLICAIYQISSYGQFQVWTRASRCIVNELIVQEHVWSRTLYSLIYENRNLPFAIHKLTETCPLQYTNLKIPFPFAIHNLTESCPLQYTNLQKVSLCNTQINRNLPFAIHKLTKSFPLQYTNLKKNFPFAIHNLTETLLCNTQINKS